MIEQLFGSKTRVKLLQMFYTNPNRSFYVREITRKIDEQINSVRRELANLLSIGIITSDTSNNKLYYEVSQTYEYYEPLKAIFGSPTTAAPTKDKKSGDEPASDVTGAKGIDLLLLTGQLTRDERSGIDVLIVGGLTQGQAAKYIAELEAKESKELRYAVMTTDEFTYRQKIKDRFISVVLEAKSQIVIDKNYLVLPRPAKTASTKDKEKE